MGGAHSDDISHPRAKIGPGRVVLIAGPSGAGKDTLIGLARARLAPGAKVVFPQRCVTREASAAEDNIVLTPEAFAAGIESGAFLLFWRAHGVEYAIPVTIAEAVARGECVVLNVSRTVIDQARDWFAEVSVVYIDAPVDVRARRIAYRGRETADEVALRLARAPAAFEPAQADLLINNEGEPGQAAEQLVEFLSR